MIELSQQNLLREQSEELPVLIHNVNDMERIGDRSQNVAELTKRKVSEKLPFSNAAIKEIQTIWQVLNEMFLKTKTALELNDPQLAREVLALEDQIDQLEKQLKSAHIQRLHKGECKLESGFVFVELLANIEKVGDRLTNVAQSVIGKMKWEAKHPSQT